MFGAEALIGHFIQHSYAYKQKQRAHQKRHDGFPFGERKAQNSFVGHKSKTSKENKQNAHSRQNTSQSTFHAIVDLEVVNGESKDFG